LKEWMPIGKRLKKMNDSLPVPSEPFRVEDVRLVKMDCGYVAIHKNEKIFDSFGINPILQHGILKEIINL